MQRIVIDESWHARVVSRLREHRAAGYTFDIGWSMVMKEMPPPQGTRGAAVPQLFDETGSAPDSQLGFFRRACENAWHGLVGPVGSGQGPALRDFAPDMVRVIEHEGHRGVVRQAA